MSDNAGRFDAVARRVINEWMIGFSIESPELRVDALHTIARIAEALALKIQMEEPVR